MAEDAGLRSQYAGALAAAIRRSPIVVLGDVVDVGHPPATTGFDLADAVLAVRDEELERLRAKADAARRMLDSARAELHREREAHGAVVAVLARVRALAEEWAAAGADPVEPSDGVVAECGQELLARLGTEQEDWFQRLCAAVEAVLLDHHEELDEAGKVDANLADLAHLYRGMTGFDAKEEVLKDAPKASETGSNLGE